MTHSLPKRRPFHSPLPASPPNKVIRVNARRAMQQQLYGRRFVLLVKDGVQLPSNLQGLCDVRYSGKLMDVDSNIRLLEAISDIQNHPIQDRHISDAT